MGEARQTLARHRAARQRPAGWRLLAMSATLVVVLLAACPGVASAKSGSRPIAPPSPETVVFTVSLAGRSYEYTWADVSGDGRLGQAVTHSYLLDTEEQDPEEWSGVWLRTVLADVEARSGITLDDDWKLKVTCVDAYVCARWVEDVKDAANNYLLATDPVEGCDTEDPTDPSAHFYEPTYVRICTNGDYGNSAYPARLVKASESITVLGTDGNEIPPEAHGPIGVIVAGDDVEAPASMKTYSGDAYWLTEDELVQLAASRGVEGPFADLWKTETYSFCENHGTPVYGFAVGAGIGLKELLNAAGLDDDAVAAQSQVVVTASGDSFSTTLDLEQAKYRFATPDAVSGDAVDPLLALYKDEADEYALLPAEATTAVGTHTTLLHGQVTPSESNKCAFVSGADLVSLPCAADAFVVDAPDAYGDGVSDRQKTAFSLASLVFRGTAQRSYEVDGVTHVCDGLDLATVLHDARGKICPQDKVTVVTASGTITPAGLAKVADVTEGAYLLAYYSEDAERTAVANGTQTTIYGDRLAVRDVLGVRIEHVSATSALRLVSPTASQQRAYVVKGSKLALRAITTKTPGATAADPVLWQSSNRTVATVEKTGNGMVTVKKCGSARITATSGSRSASFTVKVVRKALNARKVTLPARRTVAVGSVARLVPRLYPSNSTATITWKSSNPKVAAVDRAGQVTGAKKGKATITVRTSNGKRDTCVVTVK